MEFSKIKDKSLLASVSLFRELYDSEEEKNITDILFKFIIGVVILDGSYMLNSTEIKNLLEKHYGFNILESVIRTTLKRKTNNNQSITFDKGVYVFDKSIETEFTDINLEISKIESSQNKIINLLFLFIEGKLSKELTDTEKKEVVQSLISFLLDNSYSNGYTDFISVFIIANEKDTFTESLNSIKEGVILYQGLGYDESTNEHKNWSDNLTLYLSTENLFNCLGYNGSLYQEIFNDFYQLVQEINVNKKNTGKISLRFFEETKSEINSFFKNAELIKQGKFRLDYSVTAMKSILSGCQSINDIHDKNILFFNELKNKGIEECSKHYNSLDLEQYNVTDLEIVKQLSNEAKEKKKNFSEDECLKYMDLFTKVNILRRGQNNRKFEKIRYLYITENSFVKYLGHNNKIKFQDTDTAFTKDLDFLITKFWFTLNKGFNNSDLPKSFDVVTKAKIMISSHLKNKISKAYEKLSEDVKNGVLTKEDAIEFNHEYRKKAIDPESVRIDNIGESIDFIMAEDNYEVFLREKENTKKKLEDSEQRNSLLEKELELYKQEQVQREKQEQEAKEKAEENQRIIQLNRDKNLFADNMWKKEKNQGWCNFSILVLFIIVSIFTLFLTILATNEKLQNKCTELFLIDKNIINNNYLWAIIILAIIIFILDMILFYVNKNRIKNGFQWIKHLFDPSYKNRQKEFYKHQYIPDK